MFMATLLFYFLSHNASKEELAAYGLAQFALSRLYNIASQGFNSALITLASQAFGLEEYELCGHYLRRQQVLAALFFLPFGLLSFFSESIFLLFGQNPQVAALAQTFLRIDLIGAFADS